MYTRHLFIGILATGALLLSVRDLQAQDTWGETYVEASFDAGLPAGWIVNAWNSSTAAGAVAWEVTTPPSLTNAQGKNVDGFTGSGKVAWVHRAGASDYLYTSARCDLISPSFVVKGRGNILRFRTWEDIEWNEDPSRRHKYDRRKVWIKIGASWYVLADSKLNSFFKGYVTPVTVSLDDLTRFDPTISMQTGVTVKIAFQFDTVDSFNNYHTGWIVDDVKAYRNDAPFYSANGGVPSGDSYAALANDAASDPEALFVDPVVHKLGSLPPRLYIAYVKSDGKVRVKQTRFGGTWDDLASWDGGNTLTVKSTVRPRIVESDKGTFTLYAVGTDNSLYRRSYNWSTSSAGAWQKVSDVSAFQLTTNMKVYSQIVVTNRLALSWDGQPIFTTHLAYLSQFGGYWYLIYLGDKAAGQKQQITNLMLPTNMNSVGGLALASDGRANFFLSFTSYNYAFGNRTRSFYAAKNYDDLAFADSWTADSLDAPAISYMAGEFHVFHSAYFISTGKYRLLHRRYKAVAPYSYVNSTTVANWKTGGVVGLSSPAANVSVVPFQLSQVSTNQSGATLVPSQVDMEPKQLVLLFRRNVQGSVTAMRWDKITGWTGVNASWGNPLQLAGAWSESVLPVGASFARKGTGTGSDTYDMEGVLCLRSGLNIQYTSLFRSLVGHRFADVGLSYKNTGTDNRTLGDDGNPGYPSMTQPKELLPIGNSTLQSTWTLPEWFIGRIYHDITANSTTTSIEVSSSPITENWTNYHESFAPAWGGGQGWAGAELNTHVFFGAIIGQVYQKPGGGNYRWSGPLPGKTTDQSMAAWDAYIQLCTGLFPQGGESGHLDHIIAPPVGFYYAQGQGMRDFLAGTPTSYNPGLLPGTTAANFQPIYDWVRTNIYNGLEFVDGGGIKN